MKKTDEQKLIRETMKKVHCSRKLARKGVNYVLAYNAARENMKGGKKDGDL